MPVSNYLSVRPLFLTVYFSLYYYYHRLLLLLLFAFPLSFLFFWPIEFLADVLDFWSKFLFWAFCWGEVGSCLPAPEWKLPSPEGHNKVAIFSHFPPGFNVSQQIRGKNISRYQPPKPPTPLVSPTDILVSVPAGPHTLFVVAWSQNPGAIFWSILAEEFSAGILFTCVFGQSQSLGSQKLTEL